MHKIGRTSNAYVIVAGKFAERDRLSELGIDGRTTAIIRVITLTFQVEIFRYVGIFVNYNWVDTPLQQFSTHLPTNHTQSNAINLGTVRAVPCLCELYPGICLTTEENHRKTSVNVEKS